MSDNKIVLAKCSMRDLGDHYENHAILYEPTEEEQIILDRMWERLNVKLGEFVEFRLIRGRNENE